MANFGLSKLRVDLEQARPYTFPFCLCPDETRPVRLFCVPAGAANKKAIAAAVKMSAQEGGGRKAASDDPLGESQRRSAALFAKHVVKGWENVFDVDTGQAVPFSVEECEKFLVDLAKQAPDYMLRFTSWADDLDNFRDVAVVIAKN